MFGIAQYKTLHEPSSRTIAAAKGLFVAACLQMDSGCWELLELVSYQLTVSSSVPRGAMQKVASPELSCSIYTVCPFLHEVTLSLGSSPAEVESTNYGGKFCWAGIQDQVGLSFSLFSY